MQLEESQLNPGVFTQLKAQTRAGIWSVESVGSVLRVRNPAGLLEVRAQFRQAVMALLASLAIAATLIGAAVQVDLAFAIASGIMALLFFVSAFFAVLALLRARHRRDEQAHLLEVAGGQVRGGLVPRGLWKQYQQSHRSAKAADVKSVKLAVHRDPKRFNAKAVAFITVELMDGDGLLGPEVSGPDGEWMELRAALWPLAVALGHQLGKTVEVEYAWCGQWFVREP